MYIRAAVTDIHDEPNEVKYGLIYSPTTRPSTLAELAKDPNTFIRVAVAQCLNTPVDTLISLLDDSASGVRCSVANNPNLPMDVLLSLADDADPNVRRAVISNEDTPLDIAEAHLDDDNACVRFVAARRLGRLDNLMPNLPKYGIVVRDDIEGNFDDDEWIYRACSHPGLFEDHAIAVTSRGVEFGEPDWWEDTSAILNRMKFNSTSFPKFAEDNRGVCPEGALEGMYKIAFKYGDRTSPDFLYDAIRILNPQYNLAIVKTHRYGEPSNWVACIYDIDEMDIYQQELQDWYFWDAFELETYRLDLDDDFFETADANSVDFDDLWDFYTDYGHPCEDFTCIGGSEYREYLEQGEQALLEHLADVMGHPVEDCVIV